MATRVVVLVLESDESEGNPLNWNWTELIDSPYSVSAVIAEEIESEPTLKEIETLVALTHEYGDAIRSLPKRS
jgi:hypothetical protein